ncbi:MAG: hypothetical protein EPO07_06630 [Verrucomicrobia bacterium]|nr:MAG: hypothetical protein EPO07_06630 [Verrucomicrobiota bacterium]
MKTPASLLPDSRTLTAGLTAALNSNGDSSRGVKVLDRKLPRFMSTFPNEIVTCRLPNGRKRRVFIKYTGGQGHSSFGHRGDIAYEAEVYQRLLRALPEFHPQCLGVHTDSKRGDTWLVLEYAYGSVRVSDLSFHHSTRQPRALAQSARWIGEFHAAHETRVGDPEFAFLKRYDTDYYRGWVRRTHKFATPLLGRFPWLTELCLRSGEWIAPLLAATPTVIHGEFYAKTVLVRSQRLFMVDWESAAIAPGEIDLASLTESRNPHPQVARRCERAYTRARWPDGVPAGFQHTLDAARIYLHFRWLGERPDWTVREKTLWRFANLHVTAKKLGLID